MSALQITKTDYLAGVQCSKRLYQLLYKPDLATTPTADLLLRFEQGRTVGEVARNRFPDGILVTESGSALPQALARTKSLVEELKTSAIFEAAFQHQNFLARVDILKNNFDGSWDLIEVKATTETKPEHLEDVAFQLWVLQGCGVDVRHVYLSHINTDIRFPDLDEFFVDNDFTDAANAKAPEMYQKLMSLVKALENSEAPKVRIGKHCTNPHTCEFKSHCWEQVPKGSVLELYNYRKRKPTKFDLYHEGPKLIEELGNDVELTPFQRIQVSASRSEGPVVDYHGLAEFLSRVNYPIYYFDFETIAPAIPILNGMRPYQRIPLQFSCHVQRSPGGDLEHHEFLASINGKTDPRRECIGAMIRIFEQPGSIIAYHDDFERSLIRELAEQFPETSDCLLQLEEQFIDLEDAFHSYFYHRDFGGSVSIKKVLPFFAPDMKYDTLAIQNGGQAQAALAKLLNPELAPEDRRRLRRDLLEYCAQDSMAMVVIHQKLSDLLPKNLEVLQQA